MRSRSPAIARIAGIASRKRPPTASMETLPFFARLLIFDFAVFLLAAISVVLKQIPN